MLCLEGEATAPVQKLYAVWHVDTLEVQAFSSSLQKTFVSQAQRSRGGGKLSKDQYFPLFDSSTLVHMLTTPHPLLC